MGASGYVHVPVQRILYDSGKAFKCQVHGCDVWIPHFAIADCGDYEEGDHDLTLSIREDIAEEKGLEGE